MNESTTAGDYAALPFTQSTFTGGVIRRERMRIGFSRTEVAHEYQWPDAIVAVKLRITKFYERRAEFRALKGLHS